MKRSVNIGGVAIAAIAALSVCFALEAASGMTIETVFRFSSVASTNGLNPQAELIRGPDGNFYGTTLDGGATGHGTVFRVAADGTFTNLVSFYSTNGSKPTSMVLGSDGALYGTTLTGGTNGTGTLFRLATNGTLDTLAAFSSGSGTGAKGIVFGNDGCLYGTSPIAFFRWTTKGGLENLALFQSASYIGPNPGLIQGVDGDFYGTASGLSSGWGSVYRVATNGQLRTVYSFSYSTGARPYGGVVQSDDGNLYGTTSIGGPGASGTVFCLSTNGALTTLATWSGREASPHARLARGSDGAFYGTTFSGGAFGWGSVFRVSTNGVLTTLASFASTNGAFVYNGLVIGSDGALYGVTPSYTSGANWYDGTIFRVRPAMLPPVAVGNGWLIRFQGLPEHKYRVFRASRLVGETWAGIADVLPDQDGTGGWTDVEAPADSAFYRVGPAD